MAVPPPVPNGPLMGEDTAAELARKDKIIRVLMDRVELGMDTQGSDYSFFQATILLGEQVRERTQRLDEAMLALQRTNAALAHEKRAAEGARVRLYEAISGSSDGLAFFDDRDCLIVANPEFATMWASDGLPLLVVEGASFDDIVAAIVVRAANADLRGIWRTLHEQARQGHSVRAEVMVREGFWIRISERPTADGGVVGTYADISEIKRQENLRREKELAAQALLLQTTLDNLAQGVVVFDGAGRLLVWNDRLAGMLGLSVTELAKGLPRSALPEILSVIPQTPEQGHAIECALPDGRTFSARHAAMPDGGTLVTLTDITMRKHQEARIQELLDELRATFDNAHVGIAHIRNRVFITCNARMAAIFGWESPDHLIGRTTEVLYAGAEEWEADGQVAYDDLQRTGYSDREYEFRRRDGSPVWCHRTGRPVDQANPQGGSIWVYADITERRAQEHQLRLAHTVFENTSEALMITDSRGNIVDVNRAFCRITGYAEREVIGRNPSMFKSGRHAPAFYAEMWETLLRTGAWSGEVFDRRKSGEIYPKWLSISTVRNQTGEVLNYIGSFQDISERKAAEEKIHYLAHHDVLTALPNRLLLRDRFGQAMERTRRSACSLAFMFLDLDEFKRVNDSLGHRVGDELLVAAVKRLKGCLREIDTISRQGGDEFIVLLNEIDTPVAAASAASKIIAAMAEPFDIAGQPINSSVSIGIAMAPADGYDFDSLLQKADIAMYHSKARGHGGYSFFRQEMNDAAIFRHTLVSDLHNALARSEFLLYYQPQLALGTMQVRSAEALVRWVRSDGNLVRPADFVPVAEETGLILPIGEWVMHEACRQARLWSDGGLPIRIAVNVSGIQIYRSDVPALVARCTGDAGISPSLVEIELTESTLIQDTSTVREVIGELKTQGCSIAIDDFGTGYSSLSYLSRFNVDKLKIDRSFIAGSGSNEEDEAIVHMIAQMAHMLKLRAIAEGVECREHMELLRRCNCDEAQGYFIGRPVDAVAFEHSARQPLAGVPAGRRA
jgi:diguanylate cyclase (GGDEF)-like protein/PAS domain S-box-containing protein